MKNVQFCPEPAKIINLHVWKFANQSARNGTICIQAALDRERFRHRIKNSEDMLNHVLKTHLENSLKRTHLNEDLQVLCSG